MRLTLLLRRSLSNRRLVFGEFGDPTKVLKVDTVTITEDPKPGEVIVKMLATPVNPADINVIQGVYPIRPKEFPAVGGGEGVGVIEEAHESTQFKKGDLVIPAISQAGTWQQYLIRKAQDFIKVNKALDVKAAAMLAVNPPTALRMLLDFEKLQPGDTVAQNGGNSGVGISVIQLCSIMGLKSISVVRDRENIRGLKSYLESLGKDSIVLTEEEFRTYKCKYQLALNTVGGKGVVDLVKNLDFGRTMVTYGGMSKLPLYVPTSVFIFKNVVLKGFWMTRWKNEATVEEQAKTRDYLTELYISGKLKPQDVTEFSLDNFKEALECKTKALFIL